MILIDEYDVEIISIIKSYYGDNNKRDWFTEPNPETPECGGHH